MRRTAKQVTIHGRHGKSVAIIAADEMRGLVETTHLLRSPKNAQRLLTALRRAQGRKGRPQSLDKLRAELGLDDE